jgi:cyclopropane fatty-acyl-phospholipid synthase-like methyltransferase
MKSSSREVQHFERLYRVDPDPWSFATSAYERQKYDATLDVLGTRRFIQALEVGCSIGVLTTRLAGCCEQLLALDFAPSAVAAARARCAPHPGVMIEQKQVPRQWPRGWFDLILFSEVLYFLDESDLKEVCARTMRSMVLGGWVLLVNYTGVTDDPVSGDRAAELFIKETASFLQPRLHRRESQYRLDLLVSE